MEHATRNTQHATRNTQHATWNMEHGTMNAAKPLQGLRTLNLKPENLLNPFNLRTSSLKSGFTLIELIIYIAIAATVLVFAVNFALNLIVAHENSRGKQEVYSNARLVMSQISQNIRAADDIIVGSSTFNMNPGSFMLDYPGTGTDVVIDTYTTVVNGVTVRKLRIKEGSAAAVDVTSNKVNVTNFVVRHLTRGSERKNLNIELTLAKLNPGNDPDYNAAITVETSVSIRK